MASCGPTSVLINSDPLNPPQQLLINSAVAIFFEQAATKLFSYLTHHPSEEFSITRFANVLKSTILDDPITLELHTVFECVCQDIIVLEEMNIDDKLKTKILECVQLQKWISTTFSIELNITEWSLTRGLLLASNPKTSQEELQQKIARIYSDCETSDDEDYDDSSEDYHDDIDCVENHRCENCTNIDTASSRYHSDLMKLTPIGNILDSSIHNLEDNKT